MHGLRGLTWNFCNKNGLYTSGAIDFYGSDLGFGKKSPHALVPFWGLFETLSAPIFRQQKLASRDLAQLSAITWVWRDITKIEVASTVAKESCAWVSDSAGELNVSLAKGGKNA